MEYKTILLVLIATLLHTPRLTLGAGVIDIHFLSYEDDCREVVGTNKCDPMFTFCVTRPDDPESVARSKCYYKATSESSPYSNDDYINFEGDSNLNGLANPWIIKFDTLDGDSIKLVWRVQDVEPTLVIGSQHLATVSTVFKVPVWPNENVAQYAERKSKESDHVLRFKIRIYCTRDTYGPQCAVYCPPPSADDRYYCDPETGDKKCIDGWEGENCNTNVDECVQGICAHGDCTDTVGSYTCENCRDKYSGPNCDIPEDPCQEKPCQDRGQCIRSSTQSSQSQYRCECFYPYTGTNCDDESPTTTSTTTLSPPTTTPYPITPMLSTTPEVTGLLLPGETTTPPEDTSRTTDGSYTGSTNAPVAAASTAESASFDTWILLVIGLGLILVVGSVIICFVCRRKKRRQRRKESRTPLPSVTYDGENLAFDNVAYNEMNFNDSTQERPREGLPPLPSAPAMTQLNPSFKPEDDVKNGHEDMDDDGYVKANALSTFTRDSTDGLTASGRRAESNLYSNFDKLRGADPTAPVANQDDYEEEEEEHYHDLDEAAMAVRMNNNNNNNNNGDGDLRPLSAEEEGAYSDLPRNTPSYKDRQRNHYDDVNIRPRSRALPSLSNPPEEPSSRPTSKPNPSQKSKKGRQPYPEMTNTPLRRSDPFANQVLDDDYTGPDIDLPTRGFGSEYETPRNSQKGGRGARAGEGGYEMPTGNGFEEGGASKRSNESGGYEVPDRPPAEYDNLASRNNKGPLPPPPIPQKPVKTSAFHLSASTPPATYSNNQHQNAAEEDVEIETLSFPPPPPPLSAEDLNEVEERSVVDPPTSRPLSFHHGKSEKEDVEDGDDDDGETKNKKRFLLGNDGFLNPLFGGQGPSDFDPTVPSSSTDENDIAADPEGSSKEHTRTPPTITTGGSSSGPRPLSFHYGRTEIEKEGDEEKEEEDNEVDDDLSNWRKKRLENSGFMNPTFDSDGPRGLDQSDQGHTHDKNSNKEPGDVGSSSGHVTNDGEASRDGDDDVVTTNDENASSFLSPEADRAQHNPVQTAAPKPGAVPLYMENFGFSDMESL